MQEEDFPTETLAPGVVNFLHFLQKPKEDAASETAGKHGRAGQPFKSSDMHRLLQPGSRKTADEAQEGASSAPVVGVPLLRAAVQGGEKAEPAESPSEPCEAKAQVPLQADEELDAAFSALLAAVRQSSDFQVQEVLQVVKPEKLLRRKDSDGHTALHVAAMAPPCEQAAAVASFLQHCGADLEAKNMLGETPLILAVKVALEKPESAAASGQFSIVSCLLEGRADANASDALNGETPLMEAACRGNEAMSQLLLDKKAEVSKVTEAGSTAIDFARCEGYESLAHLLSRALEAATRPPSPRRPVLEAPFATASGFSTWSAGPLMGTWQATWKDRSMFKDAEESNPEPETKEKHRGAEASAPQTKPVASAFAPGGVFWNSTVFGASSARPGGYGSGFDGSSRLPFSGSGTTHTPGFAGARAGGCAGGSPEPGVHGKVDPQRHQRLAVAHHYNTLGVSPDATAEEVRAAYRKLALQYHPDKNQGGTEEAIRRFREVQQAYEAVTALF